MQRLLVRLVAVVLLVGVASAQGDPKLDFDRVTAGTLLVDPYSYWQQPYNFYYFRNMDKVPNQRIDWLRKPDRPFPLKAPSAPYQPTYTIDGRTWSLDEYLDERDVMAFVVLKDDQIVLEKYLHGAGPEDRFISFSVGKSVTSVLVGVAMDEGKIDSVDDPVTKYLPSLAGTAYDGVTLENVLQMATGVRYDESYLEPDSDIHRVITALIRGDETFHDIALSLGAREPERKPGTAFDYQSIDTQVLTHILETATGTSLSAYAEEKLWQKLGAERDAFYFQSERQTETCGFACFNATARDYARFALMAMNRGELGGTRIVSEQWMRDSTTAPAFADNYGYQWWLNRNSADRAFRAVGIYGQTLYINPAKRVVIVQFSARPRASGGGGGGAPTPFDAIAEQVTSSDR